MSTTDVAGSGTHPTLLSVIIPALHVDLELRRCIASVQLALPPDAAWEIVLVLPPGHVHAADALEGVRVVRETRRGVYGAMNDGVAASRGSYLYFLGKDDILLPSVRHAMEVLAESRPGALFCDVYWGDEGVRPCRPRKWMVLFYNVCQQGIIYSRESVLRHGPFVRRLRVQADHLLNIKMLWDPAGERVRYLRAPLAWYSATGLSFAKRDAIFHRIHPAIVRRYLGPVVAWMWREYVKVRRGAPEKGSAA
ncbi:MAG TPA: glycosyltransferase [Ramlibacter sp.]|jgi:glycosyltransferase involved in cell wall biosynthesis